MRIQQYLAAANDGPVDLSEKFIEEFGDACKTAIRRQFTEPARTKFTLRMSNVGRPLCQLQMEASGVKGTVRGYNMRMVSLFGDVIEAAAVALLQASGTEISERFEGVTLDVGGSQINGTFDVIIGGKLWDIKSCSKYQWDTKFGPEGSFERLIESDDFGYVAQGFGYAAAKNVPFGGWIVINKNTGEWHILAAPARDKLPYDVLKKIEDNVVAIKTGAPFKRCFTDEPEKFRTKPTGNRVLGSTCGFCDFKDKCWPDVKALPSLPSSGMNKKTMYYTHVDPKWSKENTEGDETGKGQ